jgi:hypothetical protein
MPAHFATGQQIILMEGAGSMASSAGAYQELDARRLHSSVAIWTAWLIASGTLQWIRKGKE